MQAAAYWLTLALISLRHFIPVILKKSRRVYPSQRLGWVQKKYQHTGKRSNSLPMK